MAPLPQAAEGQAGNPFLGGVAAGSPTPGTLSLTLEDAVARGLAHNLGALLAGQTLKSAEASRDNALSGLLPHLSAGLSATRQQINLEAYGFTVAPGDSPVVGPFNVVDARVYLSQALLDPGAADRWRAGKQGLEAARAGAQDAREAVVLACAGLYLRAALGASRIEAARAQASVAETLHQRAVRLKESGTVAGIEVLRARVQMQAVRQRVIFEQNEFAKEKLALARAIGLPLGQSFELAQSLVYRPGSPADLQSSLEEALRARSDLKQADSAVAAAEATRKSDRSEALPVLRFNADYGWIGADPQSAERTYSLGAGLRIPIFEGGRIDARTRQADAALEQVRARRDDLRGRIEFEVRAALLDLQAADERVQVAREARDLADEQLIQSQDRFAAGVAGNLEVVQAQDAVTTASDNYLSALYAHNTARLALARAIGGAERSLGTLLGDGKGKDNG